MGRVCVNDQELCWICSNWVRYFVIYGCSKSHCKLIKKILVNILLFQSGVSVLCMIAWLSHIGMIMSVNYKEEKNTGL